MTPQDDELDEFDVQSEYNFDKIGSYGRFVSGNGFPIDYVMLSFSAAQLSKLSFARDIQPEISNLDFNLLIQRDIDEDRVKLELEPYLLPREDNSRSRVVFFPPILAAILPVKNRTMLPYYTDERRERKGERLVREWPQMFVIEHKSTSSSGFELTSLVPELDTVKVNTEPARIRCAICDDAGLGVKLIVIDGQHRLWALKELIKNDTANMLQHLVVPVCLVFAPSSTEAAQAVEPEVALPTVTDVFRDLFVDVNSTMEKVSGHFRILLSARNIGDLACRQFCQQVLKDEGVDALSLIEWNTKKDKESKVIRKDYSLTSLGPLYTALEENLRSKRSLLSYLLNLAEVQDELYPEVDEEEESEFPEVDWGQFSYTQRAVLERQIQKYLLPVLKAVYFDTARFKEMRKDFDNKLKQVRAKAEGGTAESAVYQQVLNNILLYQPIGKENARVMQRIREFEEQFDGGDILRFAIVQRGVFYALFKLMLDIGEGYNIRPEHVVAGVCELLDVAFQLNSKQFEASRSFNQYTMFNGTDIKPKARTRIAVADSVMACLANEGVAKKVAHRIRDRAGNGDKPGLEAAMMEIGRNAATTFINYYESECGRDFKKRYTVDETLSKDERDELARAEIRQEAQRKKISKGEMSKKDWDKAFDALVTRHISEKKQKAETEFAKVIGVGVEVLGAGEDLDEDDDT